MSMSLDTSELDAFADDLAAAAARIKPAVRPALDEAGQNVSDAYTAQTRASRTKGFHRFGDTISHEVLPDGMTVEVGPDRGRGGAAGLAGFFYGWPNGGGGRGDLDGPLEAEAPRMARQAAEAIERLL